MPEEIKNLTHHERVDETETTYDPAAALAGLACKLMQAAPNVIGTDQGDVANCEWASAILAEKDLIISALQSHIHELNCKKGTIFVDGKCVKTMEHHSQICNDLRKCEELIERLTL